VKLGAGARPAAVAVIGWSPVWASAVITGLPDSSRATCSTPDVRYYRCMFAYHTHDYIENAR
jgi:hypothetical protein